MILRRLLILASGGMLLLGAACGGGDDSPSEPSANNDDTATTAAQASNAAAASGDCDTLTKADAEAAFGAGFGEAEDTSQGATTICSFERPDPFANVQYVIKPTSAGEYDATIEASKGAGAKAESVAGIGEKAVRLTTTKFGVTVVQTMAVKGSALFYVMGDNATGTDNLAKVLASRL